MQLCPRLSNLQTYAKWQMEISLIKHFTVSLFVPAYSAIGSTNSIVYYICMYIYIYIYAVCGFMVHAIKQTSPLIRPEKIPQKNHETKQGNTVIDCHILCLHFSLNKRTLNKLYYSYSRYYNLHYLVYLLYIFISIGGHLCISFATSLVR